MNERVNSFLYVLLYTFQRFLQRFRKLVRTAGSSWSAGVAFQDCSDLRCILTVYQFGHGFQIAVTTTVKMNIVDALLFIKIEVDPGRTDSLCFVIYVHKNLHIL